MASQPPSNPYQFESQTPYEVPTQVQQLVKPKAIKVFGILNVCFGGLGLLVTCVGLGAILAMTTFNLIPIPKGPSNPAFVTQDENAFLYFYNIISAAVALLFCYCLTCQRHWFIETQEVGANYGFGMGRLLRPRNDRSLGRNLDTHLPLSTGNDG